MFFLYCYHHCDHSVFRGTDAWPYWKVSHDIRKTSNQTNRELRQQLTQEETKYCIRMKTCLLCVLGVNNYWIVLKYIHKNMDLSKNWDIIILQRWRRKTGKRWEKLEIYLLNLEVNICIRIFQRNRIGCAYMQCMAQRDREIERWERVSVCGREVQELHFFSMHSTLMQAPFA